MPRVSVTRNKITASAADRGAGAATVATNKEPEIRGADRMKPSNTVPMGRIMKKSMVIGDW